MEKHSHKDIPGTAMGLLYKIYLQYVASAYRSAISGS